MAQRISTSRAPIANLHAPAIQPQRRPPRACVCLLIAMCQARPRSASTLESWEVVRTAWRLIFGMKPLEPPFGSRGDHGPRVRSPRGATDLGFGTWGLGLGRRRGRGRGGCTASFRASAHPRAGRSRWNRGRVVGTALPFQRRAYGQIPLERRMPGKPRRQYVCNPRPGARNSGSVTALTSHPPSIYP